MSSRVREGRHIVGIMKGKRGNIVIIIRKVLDNFMTGKNVCSYSCYSILGLPS